MGIQGLMKLLSDECPGAIREHEIENYMGRKVAVDASMALYQFMIAVRSAGDGGGASQMLTNDAGEVTSHLQGFFNRTIRMLSSGIKPVWVFDGKPPRMKSGELLKRSAKRAEAEEALKQAQESGTAEDVERFSKRTVRVTRQHNDDCKRLLRLMGVPFVEAPSEAEAQCAAMARAGHVFGAATEDMDALTFRTPKLLRKMTVAASRKEPVLEVDFERALQGLNISYDQFVDLCILSGCDYCDAIKGIGAKTALKMLRKYGSIEGILSHMDKSRYSVPPNWTAGRRRIRVYRSGRVEAVANVQAGADGETSSATSSSSSGGAAEEETEEVALVDDDEEQEQDQEQEQEKEQEEEEEAEDRKPFAAQAAAAAVAEPTSEPTSNTQVAVATPVAAPATTDDDAAQKENDAPPQQPQAEAEAQPAAEHNEANDGYGKKQVAPEDQQKESEQEQEKEEEEEEEDEVVEEKEVDVDPAFVEARRLFHEPEVLPESELQLNWGEPDEPGLIAFLVGEMGFAQDRVEAGIRRLKASRSTTSQQRMDSFFRPTGVSQSSTSKKRKANQKGKAAQKKSKTGGFRR